MNGLILCAHGVDGTPGVAETHAAAIQRRNQFTEVRACCLDGQPGLADTLETLAAPRVYLVPLLMAEGHSMKLLRQQLACLPAGRVTLCRPVGTNPRLSDLLGARADGACAAQGWRPDQTTLIVVGHGTRRDSKSEATLQVCVDRLNAGGRFRDVIAAFLDQPPALTDVLSQQGPGNCLAVGFFTDAGPHGEEDVPQLIAAAGSKAVYAGPIGTDPAIVDLILEQVNSPGST